MHSFFFFFFSFFPWPPACLLGCCIYASPPRAFLFENVAGLVTGDGGSRRAVSPDGVDGGDVGHESTLDNRAADIEIDNDNGGTNHSSGSAGSSTAVSSATHRSNSNSNETESASTNQEQQPQQQPPQQKRRWPGAGQKTIFEAGRTFQHILDSFAAEGYDVSWQVMEGFSERCDFTIQTT